MCTQSVTSKLLKMAGIPNSEASEEGEKQCDKQVKKGSNSPETEKRDVNDDGKFFCKFIGGVRSADR